MVPKNASLLLSLSHLVTLIQNLFTGCTSRVVVNGSLSLPFPRHRGLLQGSLLSPWLFNIFIDDLACLMNASCSQDSLNALFFADDIQIQAVCKASAQTLLDTLSRWLTENKMEANLSKCGTVTKIPLSLCLGDQVIPVVKSYMYLGFPHVSSGIDWTTHVSRNITKTNALLNALLSSGHVRHWAELSRLALYKAFLRPMLDYGAPLVTQAHAQWKRRKRRLTDPLCQTWPSLWRSLETVQNKALSWIFNCSLRSLPVLRSMTALGSLESRFQELACRFTWHIGKADQEMPVRHFFDSPLSLTVACRTHPLRICKPNPRSTQG